MLFYYFLFLLIIIVICSSSIGSGSRALTPFSLGDGQTAAQATDVTFNLKDFKCMVQLCEAMTANMILRFDQPGAPLVVEPHLNHGMAEASDWISLPLLLLSPLCKSASSEA